MNGWNKPANTIRHVYVNVVEHINVAPCLLTRRQCVYIQGHYLIVIGTLKQDKKPSIDKIIATNLTGNGLGAGRKSAIAIYTNAITLIFSYYTDYCNLTGYGFGLTVNYYCSTHTIIVCSTR